MLLMKIPTRQLRLQILCAMVLCWTSTLPLHGQIILGHGQRVANQNQFYSFNVNTGLATSISPSTVGLVPALAGTPSGEWLGLSTPSSSNSFATELSRFDPVNNVGTSIGPLGTSLSAIGLDVMADGRAFAVGRPNSTSNLARLFSIDTGTGAATSVGSETAFQDALIAVGGGGSPFTISLGSVGGTLFTIDSFSRSLLSIDPNLGSASVVGGTLGQLALGNLASGIARSRYSAYAGLTGVDLNGDGQYDALYTVINSFDDDDNPATPSVRIGGIGRIDIQTGSWELVGVNPGLAFTSLGSISVPEPSSCLFVALGVLSCHWRLGRRLRASTTSA